MLRMLLSPLAAVLCFAQPVAQPGGHWAGALQIQGQELKILVDLDPGSPWQGRISIPAQLLKDFPLAEVQVASGSVAFRMAGIPGDPTFQGRLEDGQIRGTFRQGGQAFPFYLERAAREASPALAAPAGVVEKDLAFGAAPFVLPGTLTLPAGKGPWPAVVLVHGSGPQDRNESLGPNAPFRDLAWGLAKRGIVVYRYDKRTKVAPQAFQAAYQDHMTVQEETVLDAAAAAAILRGQPPVDPGKVFILGHSQGGTLLPRIGARAPFAAGFIALAGATRPMEDLILEQVQYLQVPAATQADLKARVARVKALVPGTPASGPLPFEVPASYWLDLRGYQPGLEAVKLGKPFLILQGGRDYQVTAADFAGWKQAFQGKPGATFQWFPSLNHLFMTGTGPASPKDYAVAGQVDEAVLEAIAGWVRVTGGRP